MVGLRGARGALFVGAVLCAVLVIPPAASAAGPKPRTFLRERAAGTTEPASATALALPSGFTDTTVFSGLTAPTAVRFSPDGRVFVAEKSGVIRVFASLASTTSTVFADLSSEVDDYWDRGLLGLALDPAFPTNPYVYVAYTFDAKIGGTPPLWSDACPTPPGPTTDGCVVSGRLSRLTATGNAMSVEKVLINDWCQQFPSHSIGDIRFGPDGALYMSGGDGASFTTLDYGQLGGSLSGTPTPRNPCGDPPAGIGGSETPPTAEGGALRSQSVRRPAGEPVSLDGSIVRVDPATGAALADDPLAGSANANARRVVAFGFRNPFRFTFRPGTGELWVGDVGQSTWEEIDRVASPRATPVANAGWPCYEGVGRMAAWDSANLNLCESLYTSPGGLVSPYFAYNHASTVVSGESCPTGSSSISGIAFRGSGGYPAAYSNALFFADHSRNCIWAMPPGSSGLPDPTRIVTFAAGAANPVDLEAGPGGDIWYVDLEGGKVHRIRYSSTNTPPTAVIEASPTSGPTPLPVTFDGTGSTDPDAGDTLTYSWDLDGNGAFGDASLSKASFTYATAGVYNVGLRVTDSHGATSFATVTINAGNAMPAPVIDTPAATLRWAVGDPIAYSGHATDSAGASIPPAGLAWDVTLYHCPSNCHTHEVQTFSGVASGSFAAPDHDYPSYLLLTLTATDAAGHRASTSVRLDPKTATLTLAATPSGLPLVLGLSAARATPFSATVIQGSRQSVSAASPQSFVGRSFAFDRWSDGGAATHAVVVPAGGLTLTARYLTTAWLSDLAWLPRSNAWGPVEKDRSNGEQAAGDGRTITLNGTTYAKGLGVHAASEVDYALDGACRTFTTAVGVDDEVGSYGSVVFQVWGDGTKLADSGTMRGSSATKALSVSVAGRTTLRLVVTDAGDGRNYDHADWAAPKLTCGIPTATATTAWLSDLHWVQRRNDWGPVEKDTSNGEQAAGDGHPITLDGALYTKGLGVHAASEVDLGLNAVCRSLTTRVGVDDEVGANGSVDFQVWADGTKLADSGTMTGSSATKTLTLNVTGRMTLRLVVTDAGNGKSYDHADWAAAKLTCGP